MSAFSWLLISDLHLKATHTTWSQNVVLRDMVRDIAQKKAEFSNIDFVIVSGDLAHSGKPEQYVLVETFLDELVTMLGLARTDIFMVPGNHDIDRDVCKLAFHGTRTEFHNAENVEKYLSNADERNALLKRLSGFLEFQQRYALGSSRATTADGLAYFSHRVIGNLPIGIVGLNSALACGNDQDERNVILGDRPIIDICEIIRESDVRLVIGVLHHPPFWLRTFDQRTFDKRFLPLCDVLHRGHLHEREMKLLYTSSPTVCLAIAAGAGYVWRQFGNSYSIVSVDPSAAECLATYFEYDSHSGTFEAKATEKQSLRLRGQIPGGVFELSVALSELGGNAGQFGPYLAALISERITEVPVPFNGRVVFASTSVIDESADNTYAIVLKTFLNVRNSLLAFSSCTPLNERVAASINTILAFANKLQEFSALDKSFGEEMARRLKNAAEFCEIPQHRESSFVATMKQFAVECDWEGLEAIARRYIRTDDPHVLHSAHLHLCLALANSDDPDKRSEAVKLADALVERTESVIDDYRLCFSVNRKVGNVQRAEEVVRVARGRFDEMPADFIAAITRFAIEVGNRDLILLLNGSTGATHE